MEARSNRTSNYGFTAETEDFARSSVKINKTEVNSKGAERKREREDLVRLIYCTCSLDRCIIILVAKSSKPLLRVDIFEKRFLLR